MEAPTQTLPRMEPGHVSDQVLPRVEGVGVHDDVPASEYPKWIQHRGMGPIQVQNADEEAMRVAESDALPEPPPPTEEELAKAELEKIEGRPLTSLECKIGAVQLLGFVKDKTTIVVFHPDAEPEPDIEVELAPKTINMFPSEPLVYSAGEGAEPEAKPAD